MDQDPIKQRYNELASKWLSGTITEAEKEELLNWYEQGHDKPAFIDPLYAKSRQEHERLLLTRIKQHTHPATMYSGWIRAAAAIVLIISVSVFYNTSKRPATEPLARTTILQTKTAAPIQPGSNKAVLILEDGRAVDLNSAENGLIASQSGARLSKTIHGELVYQATKLETDDRYAAYNKVEIPKGGQFKLILPDGTRVWLNAGTSLRYPTAFSGNERVVELSGEAYFEVASKKEKPFKVLSAGQQVEVLGTHFNVSAYKDDAHTRTTLLEGRVKVNQEAVLQPGQGSVLYASGKIKIEKVDTDQAVAWKNGYFDFNENIETILQKVARWYDVDIVYQSKPRSNAMFRGKILRSKSIQSVLSIMEATGEVKFKIEGRRVVVMT